MKKIFIMIIFFSLILSGCTFTSKEAKNLQSYYNSIDIRMIVNNIDLDAIYLKVNEIECDKKDYLKLKQQINDELLNQAIDIWETIIVYAIEHHNYKNYFDYKESLAYKDYYYWGLATDSQLKELSPFSYNHDESFETTMGYTVAHPLLRLKGLTVDGHYIGGGVVDKRLEGIYYLENLIAVEETLDNKNIHDLNKDQIKQLQLYLGRISPSYDGLYNNEMNELADLIFDSKEDWEKTYNMFIREGKAPYFMPLADIERVIKNEYSPEEIQKYQKMNNNYEFHEHISKYWEKVFEQRELLIYEKPEVGMRKDEVLKTTWGQPLHKTKRETMHKVYEKWTYSHDRCVFIENGIVVSMRY